MKRLLRALLTAFLLAAALPVYAAAAEPAFSVAIRLDGQAETAVSAGDVVTVTVTLERTDAAEAYRMHAMQHEIHYDGAFFRLVEGSIQTPDGVAVTDLALNGTARALYIHALSLTGGDLWQPSVQIGSFQLEVVGETGVSRLADCNAMVCRPDGSGSYPVVCYDGRALCSTQCTVTFDSCGGSAVEPQSVSRGAFAVCPEAPVREGYRFSGWCTDADCTLRWSFSQTPVTENLRLYAKWELDDGAVSYSDVWETDWFFPYVQYVTGQGLMSGVGNGRFAPEDGTSRGMVVTILWRLAGKPAANPAAFEDVTAGQWYSEAVGWAAQNGIVNGYSARIFAPDDCITREQLAAILYRYAGWAGCDRTAQADLRAFADGERVQPWAKEALGWANAAGLVNGTGQNRLEPQRQANRSQTAAVFQRFCTNILQ